MTKLERLPAVRCAIDVIVESPLWGSVQEAEAWARPAALAALPPERADCELSVVLADDQAVRRLNARFRRRNAPTNVLSFLPPAFPPRWNGGSGAPLFLGDVVLAYETTRAEAAAAHKEFLHHATHLVVHGVLHLLGYDHRSEEEADTMEARERMILMRLGMPDPYETRERA